MLDNFPNYHKCLMHYFQTQYLRGFMLDVLLMTAMVNGENAFQLCTQRDVLEKIYIKMITCI